MWTTEQFEKHNRVKVIEAIERGKEKIKAIEAQKVVKERRNDSAWLMAVNDIVDRVGLAIRDELITD